MSTLENEWEKYEKEALSQMGELPDLVKQVVRGTFFAGMIIGCNKTATFVHESTSSIEASAKIVKLGGEILDKVIVDTERYRRTVPERT